MSPELLAALLVGLGAAAQAVTGLGFALVAAPVLIAELGPSDGVAVVCVLATLASVLPLAREGRATRWRDVLRLLVPTLLALPLAAWAVSGVPARPLTVVAGATILLATGLIAAGLRARRLTGTGGAVVAGVASAAMNVVGGVGGPPVALYAENADWTVPETRASLQAFFVVQNVVTVVAVGWAAPAPGLLVALVAGTVAGTLLARRLSYAVARSGVLLVAAAGGLALLLGLG